MNGCQEEAVTQFHVIGFYIIGHGLSFPNNNNR